MRPGRLALTRAEVLLAERLTGLEPLLAAGDDHAWSCYSEAATALAAIAAQVEPGASGRLMTTAQLAERLQVSTKTILRRAKKGQLQPVRMGRRGPGALRWSSGSGR